MFYTDCDNIEIAIYAIATLPDSDKCQLVFIQKGWSSVFSLLLASYAMLRLLTMSSFLCILWASTGFGLPVSLALMDACWTDFPEQFQVYIFGATELPIVLDSSKALLCRYQRNELKTQAQLKETEHDLAVRKQLLFFLRIFALKTSSKQSSGMQCTVHTPALLSNLFLTASYMRRSTRMSSPDWIPFPETHNFTQDLVDFAKAFCFKKILYLYITRRRIAVSSRVLSIVPEFCKLKSS